VSGWAHLPPDPPRRRDRIPLRPHQQEQREHPRHASPERLGACWEGVERRSGVPRSPAAVRARREATVGACRSFERSATPGPARPVRSSLACGSVWWSRRACFGTRQRAGGHGGTTWTGRRGWAALGPTAPTGPPTLGRSHPGCDQRLTLRQTATASNPSWVTRQSPDPRQASPRCRFRGTKGQPFKGIVLIIRFC
jgi:hypothetical protein